MKTKEQVLEHLKMVGYTPTAITKIMGFLIGNGTKAATETVRYKRGNNTFEGFLAWYQAEDTPSNTEECVVHNLFRLLFDAMEMADENEDDKMCSKLDDMLNVMLDIFVIDVTDNE